MPTRLAMMMVLLAASGTAHAVTKCLSGDSVLYTSASCPHGYSNVTRTMHGRVQTVPRLANSVHADAAYTSRRIAMAELARAWRERDEAWNLAAANAFWNQCGILDYQVRGTERAMNETEYWSRADRYRRHIDALRAEQYFMGCFG